MGDARLHEKHQNVQRGGTLWAESLEGIPPTTGPDAPLLSAGVQLSGTPIHLIISLLVKPLFTVEECLASRKRDRCVGSTKTNAFTYVHHHYDQPRRDKCLRNTSRALQRCPGEQPLRISWRRGSTN